MSGFLLQPQDLMRKTREAFGGKSVRIVAGVIRNYGYLGAPDWRYIEDANHGKLQMTTLALNGRKLQVNFSEDYGKVLSFVACPDETMAAQGFTVGASVGTQNALIECGQKMQGSVNLLSGALTLHASQHWPAADFSGAVDAAGVVTITHPSNGGYQPAIFPKEPGAAYRLGRWSVKAVSGTETKIFPYAELAGYVRWDGAAFGVLTSLVAGVSVAEAGGVVTVTHPAVSAKSPPMISTRDNGSVIAMPDSYNDTSFSVKFRDFAGAQVTVPNSSMRFTFRRDGLIPAGEAQPGEAYFDLGYGSADMARVCPLGGNIWCVGVFEA